jgi:hypothetical protein
MRSAALLVNGKQLSKVIGLQSPPARTRASALWMINAGQTGAALTRPPTAAVVARAGSTITDVAVVTRDIIEISDVIIAQGASTSY